MFTPAVLSLDLAGLQQRFTETHRGWRKILGGFRSDKQELATGVKDPASVKSAIDALPSAGAWQAAERALAAALAEHGAALGAHFRGEQTDLNLVADLLAVSEQALSLGFDVAPAGRVLGNGIGPPPWMPALVEEIRRDLRSWQSMLVPGSQSGMPLQLQSLPLADVVVWLRDQVGPAEAASAFTGALSRAVQRDLTLHGTQIVLATREATEAAHVRFAQEQGQRAPLLHSVGACAGRAAGGLRAGPGR
jgi:hypothetical protein